jgi:hypothetical protein
MTVTTHVRAKPGMPFDEQLWIDVWNMSRDDDDGMFDGDGSSLLIVPRSRAKEQHVRLTICSKDCALHALLQFEPQVTGSIVVSPGLLGPERADLLLQLVEWTRPAEVCFWGDPDPVDVVSFLWIQRLLAGVRCRWIELPERYGGVELRLQRVERELIGILANHSVVLPLDRSHRDRWSRGEKIELESQVLYRRFASADAVALFGAGDSE